MTDNTPAFQWIRQEGIFTDSMSCERIRQSQLSVMAHLFKAKKQKSPSNKKSQKNTEAQKKVLRSNESSEPLSLVDWHMRRLPADLHLYAGFGLIDPLEYQFFYYHMDRWQNQIALDAMKDPENKNETTIQIPSKKVNLFLQSVAEEKFDRFENILLRFEKPIQLVHALDAALFTEGIRSDTSEAVSAIDELLCQTTYPDTETNAWIWMNKMVAGKFKSPLQVKLIGAKHALKELNKFQLYKAIADIYDYSFNPSAMQRINGQLEEVSLPYKTPRIRTALKYLIRHGQLDLATYKQTIQLDPQKREKKLLNLKRQAVSAFLADMAQASPDLLWLHSVHKAFRNYFRDLLTDVGGPILEIGQITFKDDNGRDLYVPVTKVTFSNTSKKNAENAHNSTPRINLPNRQQDK